jgi:WD40 repeat protein
VNYGFIVFNVDTTECIFKKPQAHQGLVNDMITIHNGDVLVTCSDDSTIMFWNLLDMKTQEPTMIGHMEYHKSCVSKLLKISEYSFASTSTSEKFLLLWKDSRMESLKRSFFSNQYSLMAPKYKDYKRTESMTELSALTDDDDPLM